MEKVAPELMWEIEIGEAWRRIKSFVSNSIIRCGRSRYARAPRTISSRFRSTQKQTLRLSNSYHS